MTRLSPDAYDAALARLSAFIQAHHHDPADVTFSACLPKLAAIAFLQLVIETGCDSLLNDVEAFRVEPDYVVMLRDFDLRSEPHHVAEMLKRVPNAPDDVYFEFKDFTLYGELEENDVIDKDSPEFTARKKIWVGYEISPLFRKNQ